MGRNRTDVSTQLMMQVTLAEPLSRQLIEDEVVFKQIEDMDTSIRGRKVELVLAALCSFNHPLLKKDIFSAPSFVDSVALIKRMSPKGKLYLARTLLEQITA